MKNNLLSTFLFIVLLSPMAIAQNTIHENDSPLLGFEPFIGGEWHLGDSYQIFEWGLGEKSVKARSYIKVEGKSILSSEGYWFYHPGEKVIKGYFTAVNMPASLFEFTSSAKDGKIISLLTTYDDAGTSTEYKEIMEINSQKNYAWTLYQEESIIMDGTFIKKD